MCGKFLHDNSCKNQLSNLNSYNKMNDNNSNSDSASGVVGGDGSKIVNKSAKRFFNCPQFCCFSFFRKKLFTPKTTSPNNNNSIIDNHNSNYIKENSEITIIGLNNNNNSDSASDHNNHIVTNGNGYMNGFIESKEESLVLSEPDECRLVETNENDDNLIENTNIRDVVQADRDVVDAKSASLEIKSPEVNDVQILELKEADVFTFESNETIITDLETNETIITELPLNESFLMHSEELKMEEAITPNGIIIISNPITMSPIANQYYQQTNETVVTPQHNLHQQSNEKSSNKHSPEVLSNTNNRGGSSSIQSIYSTNNSNNSNEHLSIQHNDSNSSDVNTESDSDNSTPTRVIGTSDPVINLQKVENLIQQKSPSSISRPHSVLGPNSANIDHFDQAKRPKTANIVNFDDIPIKPKSISIENIPSNDDIKSNKSETLSIENIPFDEIPIKSKTPSRENVSNISRSSSIIQDPFCRIETPTPHDIDEISSNSVGTRSDTDYEDDTTNTKSKTEMSDSFTPKSNGTAKSFSSMDMNSEKMEYNEMVDEDFIKPTIKSPQRKLKPVIFRSKKVAPAKQAAAQKAKTSETYTSSSLSRRFDRPRDALNQCIIQLESQNWETTMNGIHLFVRLMRHHPEQIDPQIHLLATHLAKHIKNLRSQVARAACQAAGEFFATHRKYLDQETEDLVTSLLHRTADTNKFLRADAGRALDSMVDNMQPAKIIHIVSTRGTTHANAVVRTSAAKLFNRLVSRLGCDKVFAMNKECRDKLILNTAQLLQEGSLETRNYAKDIFKQLSAHNNYSKVLFDVIPQRVYRNIEKTLKNIK